MMLMLFMLAACGGSSSQGPAASDPHVVDSRSGFGGYCVMAADGDTVVVAYVGPPGTAGAFLARSSDGGATFPSEKIVSVDPDGFVTKGVSVAGSVIYVAYGGKNGDVRLARSAAGGDTFSIQTIASDTVGPAMLVSGDTVHLAYQTNNASPRVFYERSTDAGATWSSPVPISIGAAIRTLSLQEAGGVLYASFDDLAPMTQTVAHSSDSGLTWVEEAGQPNFLPTGSLVATAGGLFVPLARVDEALFVSTSQDSGATWSNTPFVPVGGAFGNNPSKSEGGSIAGVRLAAAGSTLFAIFPQGAFGVQPERLGFARSTDEGLTWPAADTVTAYTATAGGPFLTYYLTEQANIAFSTGAVPAILIAFFDGSSLRVLRSIDCGTTWP
jgi:hypothetical protein